MSDSVILATLLIVICILGTCLFSLAETALVSFRRGRLVQTITGRGEPPNNHLAVIDELLKEPTRIVASVQIGVTALSLIAVAIATTTLAPLLATILNKHHVPHPVRLAVSGMVALVALLVLVIGEIVPRAIAVRRPEAIALAVASPLAATEWILRPIVAFVLWISNLIVKPFGVTASFTAPVITEEELQTLLEASEAGGVIEQDEKEMLRNVISFGDTDVHAVMTPRIDIKAVDVGVTLQRLTNLIIDCGHSRIPLYENTVDTIVGIIHAKDLLSTLGRSDTVSARSLMRSVLFIPESKRVDELLDQFRKSNSQIAIVQDEYGGTAGLVTIEDLLEEIVGEIQDEYDVEEPNIVHNDDGTLLVDSRLNIEDLNEELDVSLPHEDFDTVGGYVFGLFGRMPQQGEKISDEELDFVVAKADGRRVYKLLVCVKPDESAEAVAAAAADAERTAEV